MKYDQIPQWLIDEIYRAEAIGSGMHVDEARRFCEAYTNFASLTQRLPDRITCPMITTTEIEALRRYFPDGNSALAHLCECWTGYWAFMHAAKLKAFMETL